MPTTKEGGSKGGLRRSSDYYQAAIRAGKNTSEGGSGDTGKIQGGNKMSDVIAAAVIAALASVLGSYLANMKQGAVMEEKIRELKP